MAFYMRSTVESTSSSISASSKPGISVKWIEGWFKAWPSGNPFLKFWYKYSEINGVIGAISYVALIKTSKRILSDVR